MSIFPIRARQSFDESIKGDAQYVPPYIQISMQVAAARRCQELADVSDKALKLDSFNLNAVAHLQSARCGAAEQSARRAEKLDTRHKFPQITRLLGLILAGRREYAAAAMNFRII